MNAPALLELAGIAAACVAAYFLSGWWLVLFVAGVFAVYVARSR